MKTFLRPETPVTIQSMCKYIVSVLEKHNRIQHNELNPKDVYDYHPTGELYPVYGLYYSMLKLEGYTISIDRSTGNIDIKEPD